MNPGAWMYLLSGLVYVTSEPPLQCEGETDAYFQGQSLGSSVLKDLSFLSSVQVTSSLWVPAFLGKMKGLPSGPLLSCMCQSPQPLTLTPIFWGRAGNGLSEACGSGIWDLGGDLPGHRTWHLPSRCALGVRIIPGRERVLESGSWAPKGVGAGTGPTWAL